MSLLQSLSEMAAAQTCGNCHQSMGGNHFYRKVGGVNKRFCKGSAIKDAISQGYSPQGNVSYPLGGTPPGGAKSAPPGGSAPTPGPASGPPAPTGTAPAVPSSTRPAPPKQQTAPPAAKSNTISKQQLESWLKDINVRPEEYEVVNGRLDIKKSVHMTDQEYTQLPVPFGKIEGDFEIVMPTLTSFKNFPTEVEGNLTVFHTAIESIEELDIKIGGAFYISKNDQLKSFRKVHKHVKSVDSGITVDLDENSLGGLGFLMIPGIQYLHVPTNSKVEEIMAKYFKDDADMLDVQDELIEAGFKNIARL